jgi:TPR repeat protein
MSENTMADNRADSPTPGLQGVALAPEEITKLSDEALDGSGVAARRLTTHYLVAQGNREQAKYWAIIAAENGDVSGQYYAGFLLKDGPHASDRRRALYWLRKAAAQGHVLSESLLAELGIAPR